MVDVARAGALDEGDRSSAAGRRTVGGSCRRSVPRRREALHLHVGDDVGVDAAAELVELLERVGLPAGGHDDRADRRCASRSASRRDRSRRYVQASRAGAASSGTRCAVEHEALRPGVQVTAGGSP